MNPQSLEAEAVLYMPMTSQKSLIQIEFAVEELEQVCLFTRAHDLHLA